MRRNRIIWACLFILSLVGISFFGGSVSYGFFAIVTIVPVVSFVYLLCVNSLFHIYQKLDSKVLVANETVPFFFTLMNEYYFVFSGIRVRFHSSFSTITGLSDEIEYELLPQNGIEKETGLTCKYRGSYEVGINRVESQDYFRLFRISYHNKEPLRVMVRPQLVYLEELRSVDHNLMVKDSGNNTTEPDVLVHRYEIGDDMRHMHWSASAKSGELLMRNRIGEQQQGIGILLGTKRSTKNPKEYLPVENKMLEITLALSMFFVKKGIPVQHYHREESLVSCNLGQMGDFDEYYEMVSRIEFTQEQEDSLLCEDLRRYPMLFTCKTVFMVLHEWSPEVTTLVRELNRNNVSVVVYYVNDTYPEEALADSMTRMEIIRVSSEEKLTEVM